MSEELDTVFAECREELRISLRRKFPRLDDSAVDDIVQAAYVETAERRRHGFQPDSNWLAYLRWLVARRAVDRLRERERELLRHWSEASSMPADPAVIAARGLPPDSALAEGERRVRQGLTLSDVLQEFCRHHESRSGAQTQKQVYERALRGQMPKEIADAMGLDRNNVDQHLKRAREWILNRIQAADVDRTVFLTLHRRLPRKS